MKTASVLGVREDASSHQKLNLAKGDMAKPIMPTKKLLLGLLEVHVGLANRRKCTVQGMNALFQAFLEVSGRRKRFCGQRVFVNTSEGERPEEGSGTWLWRNTA